MNASEIKPRGYLVGQNNPKLNIIMRQWEGIKKNVHHMEDTMLALMANPQTTPEQLSLAARLYADTTQRLQEHAIAIDNYLYHGAKPKPAVYHCAFCGSTEQPIEGEGAWPYCPVCKGV
jgi:hypothetical protein